MKIRTFFGIAAVTAIAVFMAACPEPEPKPTPPGPGPGPTGKLEITLDKTEYSAYRMMPASFDDLTFKVKNTGEAALSNVFIRFENGDEDDDDEQYIADSWYFGFIDPTGDEDQRIVLKTFAVGAEQEVKIYFAGTAARDKPYKTRIIVGNSQASLAKKYLELNYGVVNFTPDDTVTISTTDPLVVNKTGVKVTGAASKGDNEWVSSDATVAAVNPQTGDLEFKAPGKVAIFYFSNNDGVVYARGKEITVYNKWTPPKPVSANIKKAEGPTKLAVVFDYPVSLSNSSGFSITGGATSITIMSVEGSDTKNITFNLSLKPKYNDSISLVYNATTGDAKLFEENDSWPVILVPDFTQAVTHDFTEADDIAARVTKVEVDAKKTTPSTWSADDAKKVYVTFDKAVTATIESGFSLSGSSTADRVTAIGGSGTAILILTLNNWASWSENGNFKLTYTREYGDIKDAAGNLVEDFTQAITLSNYDGRNNSDTLPPRIVSALVEDATPSTIRVVFNKGVTLNYPLFSVKMVNFPYKDLNSAREPGETLLDTWVFKRNITGAQPVAGSNDSIWNLTMSEPAKHGEILRLATTAEGAAVNKNSPDAKLLVIPEFIVRSMVKRTRSPVEAKAGFYRTGAMVGGVVGEPVEDPDIKAFLENPASDKSRMYDEIMRLAKFGPAASNDDNHPKEGEFIYVVLDTDQNIAREQTWGSADGNGWSYATALRGKPLGATIVITTATGRTTPVTLTLEENARTLIAPVNNIAMVLDNNIIVQRKAGVTGRSALILLEDGGKLIIDGATLRNNTSVHNGNGGYNTTNQDLAGGVTMGGGTYGGIFLMNSGSITNNTVTYNGIGPSENNSGAGAVSLRQFGILVMHGGNISGNTYNENRNGNINVRAGAIVAINNSANYHGNGNFYMTGGVISGNKVTGTAAVGSAGGVAMNGTFQKVGGTIYGSTAGDMSLANTTTLNGNVKAGAAVVFNRDGTNVPRANSTVRDSTSVPADTLFVSSYKTGGNIAENTIPEWAESFWDQ